MADRTSRVCSPQFNLETDECASRAEALRPWRRDAARAAPEPQPRSRRMVLEIFLESDALGDTKRVLVERWVFRHDAEVSAGGPMGPDAHSPIRPSVSAAYKQLVVFFRTLHAELRALPAHRYARRAAERLTEDGAETVRVAFAVSGGSREDNEREEAFSKPPPLRRARRPPKSEPGGDSGRTTLSETSLGMSGISSSGMVSSVSSSHASSSEGLGSSDGAAPKRSRSAPLSPGGGFESEKNATSHAYRAYAFAAATAPGGGRLDASVFFLDADALAALNIGDAPFVGKKAKGAYRDEIGGDAYAAADARVSSRASAAAQKEKEKEKEKARPRSAGSWKARATQFLATSPGSAKELRFAPFFFRPGADDVDPPPPPAASGSRSRRPPRGDPPRTPARVAPIRAKPDCSARRWRDSNPTRESGLPSTGPGSSSSSVFPRPSRVSRVHLSTAHPRAGRDPRRLPRRRGRRSRLWRRRRRPSPGRRLFSASPRRRGSGPPRPRAPLPAGAPPAAGFSPRSLRGSRRPRGWPSRGWGRSPSRSGAEAEAAEAEAGAGDARRLRSRRPRTRWRRALRPARKARKARTRRPGVSAA